MAVAGLYCGSPAQGEKEFKPVRTFGPPVADMFGVIGYVQMQSMFDGAFPPGRDNYWKANFIRGLSDDAIAKYQKEDITGHRPTWKMGSIGGRRRDARARTGDASAWASEDPFGLFGGPGSGQTGRKRPAAEGRKILNAQRRALDVLGLEADAKRTDIKAKFKVLVKRHHPDANGGDRTSEDQLREIIQAYNYLKSAGFC